MIKSFRDLEVYQQGHTLAIQIHQVSLSFPKVEQMELASQIRTASKSIPLNIAEGYGRKRSAADFKRFLVMALGSCNEVQAQLDVARDLKYITEELYGELVSAFEVLGRRIYCLLQNWQSI